MSVLSSRATLNTWECFHSIVCLVVTFSAKSVMCLSTDLAETRISQIQKRIISLFGKSLYKISTLLKNDCLMYSPPSAKVYISKPHIELFCNYIQ